MPWKVTVTPEVARLRTGDAGSRNVRVGETLYTFNRNPTVLDLDELPEAIKNDPHLRVSHTKEAAKAAAPVVAPKTEFVEAGTEGAALVEVPAEEPAAEAPAKKRGRPRKATAKK
jgi:hypothetical protein